MQASVELNRAGLRRYLDRVNDRWRLDGAFIGGSALSGDPGDELSAEWGGLVAAYYDRPASFIVVLVSDAFAELPWLERLYTAGTLWDTQEMGAPATVQCYTRAEFERKRETSAALRETIWHGLDLLSLI